MNNKLCANCNQLNESEMRFCVNCGADLPQISAEDLPPTVFGGNLDAGLPPTVLGGTFDSFPAGGQNFQSSNPQPLNFQQQNFSPQPQTSLRIDFAGVWMLVDAKVEVYFDNQFIGAGSVKNGFSFTFGVGSGGGAHVLELKTSIRNRRYEFVIPAGGNFLAQIDYSRTLGNFTSELNFGRY